MIFDIEKELKKIPEKPGVYIMHDINDEIIYVGKAKILKRRVRQYFQESANHTPKIRRMVENIKWFEYIVTDSEIEALVLESNLIKEESPKYNTMLKDDKTYPFIKVTVNEEFPRVLFSRDAKHDSNRYFGPFTSSSDVRRTIEFLCDLYKIRTCNKIFSGKTGMERPCLNYHIGKCDAPCAGYISAAEYGGNIDEVLKFLKGDSSGMFNMLKEKMADHVAKMEFEEAAVIRDLIDSMNHILQKQKITEDDLLDKDVIGIAKNDNTAVIQAFFIRGGKLLGRDSFHMNIPENEEQSVIVSQFLKQFYSQTAYIPSYIYLPCEPEDMDVIDQWLFQLRGKKVHLMIPKRGQKEKLVLLANENAGIILTKDEQRIKKEELRTKGALKEISDMLGLAGIHRVEAYDISNTNGIESVGSMVVFYDGKPQKHGYRCFKIKTVKGPNDYESMREVIYRRISRYFGEGQDQSVAEASGANRPGKPGGKEDQGFATLPDLILMDGGKGQVNIALSVLNEFGLNIPVGGMVKDDGHNTRGLYFNNKEIPIDTHGEGFKLITRIQDEAHRFAINYHKRLRSKVMIKSVLDDIEGVGPKRRTLLLQKFGDIEGIKNASYEELCGTQGLSEAVAGNIYKYFH